MNDYTYTTQRQVRAAFWAEHPRPRKLTNGDYPTDTRVAFSDFVDMLERNGLISESLAQRVTLTS